MSPEFTEPTTAPAFSPVDLPNEASTPQVEELPEQEESIAEREPLPVCESLADAAFILMADNWKMFDTLEHLLRKKTLKGYVTYLDLSAFLMKCKNDEKYAAIWVQDEIKAVQMLRDNWREKGRIELEVLTAGRNRILGLDKDALSHLTDFSGESTPSENFVDGRQSNAEPMAFNPFRSATTLNSLNQMHASHTTLPKKLQDALTVQTGDGYWQVSERILALSGHNPSSHDVWNLMKALLNAHEVGGVSAKGYLKVGDILPIDAAVLGDAGFRRIMQALQNEELAAPPSQISEGASQT